MTTNPSELPDSSTQTTPLRTSDRVAAILSDRIQSGIYAAGEVLPTERALAADLQVHRRSVRSAIDRLVQDGFVFRHPNCRPTVGRYSPSRPKRLTAKTVPGSPPRT